MKACDVPHETTYVFSAFFAFSEANEFFKAARAASVPAVSEAVLFKVDAGLGVEFMGLLEGTSFFEANMARNCEFGLFSTLVMPLRGFGMSGAIFEFED